MTPKDSHERIYRLCRSLDTDSVPTIARMEEARDALDSCEWDEARARALLIERRLARERSPFRDYLSTYGPESMQSRPWWNRVADEDGVKSVRRDGKQGLVWKYGDSPCPPVADVLAAIDAVDREHPLPIPTPLVGQVWILRDGGDRYGAHTGLSRMITEIDPNDPRPGHLKVTFGGRHLLRDQVDVAPPGIEPQDGAQAWPPPGAVLVHGPGAPWAPAGWVP